MLVQCPLQVGLCVVAATNLGSHEHPENALQDAAGLHGLCQRLLAPIPEPRDVGSHTLTPLVWPVGVGDGNWLVEGLGVSQGLPAFPSLDDALFLLGHIGEAGAAALCTSEMGS